MARAVLAIGGSVTCAVGGRRRVGGTSELNEPVGDKASAFGGERMPTLPFLLLTAVPLQSLVHHLSRGRPAPSVSNDFRRSRGSSPAAQGVAGVLVADLPGGARQRSALRLLESFRADDPMLPLALVTDSPNARLVRAAALHGATLLLVPVTRGEVTRFTLTAMRQQPVLGPLMEATAWFLRACCLSPESKAGRVLALRVRGRCSAEVCAEVGLSAKAYGRQVARLTHASGLPTMASMVSVIMRKAQQEPVPWDPPGPSSPAAGSRGGESRMVFKPQKNFDKTGG